MAELFAITGPVTISRVEHALTDLANRDAVNTLLLPLAADTRRPGAGAALIQFLVTTFRRAPNTTLRLSLSSDNTTTQLEKLVRQEYGLVALALAERIEARSGRSVLQEATAIATGLLQDRQPASHGVPPPAVLALIADHISGALSTLYHNNRQIKALGDFREWATECVSTLIRTASADTAFAPGFLKSLGKILYELVLNTHQWARRDLNGVHFDRSVRGVVAKYYPAAQSGTWEDQGSPHLQRFIHREQQILGNQLIGLLEVSVFDSGPGIAARMSGAGEDAHEAEYRAVVAGFAKHGTSASERGRGLGLHSVMSHLSEHDAFLRVRTGRLSVCRDFATFPYDPRRQLGTQERHDYVQLLDWAGDARGANFWPKTTGVLHTMIFPVRGSERR